MVRFLDDVMALDPLTIFAVIDISSSESLNAMRRKVVLVWDDFVKKF